jgi:aminoglycoside phosphotransferase (APT) family kinase protein
MKRLRDRWADSQVLSQGQQVLIHSDVKPPHYIFNGEYGVTAIDFEHCRSGDRAEDIGQLVAELKHRYFQGTGDLWASEAHLQHLYAGYAPVAVNDFRAFTTRGRFYQGYFEARMGQDYHWLDIGYRRRLIADAEACLTL